MKKTAVFVLFACLMKPVFATDDLLWARIKQIEANLGTLQTQVNAIPKGGIPGPRGEKGEPGNYIAGEGITINKDVIHLSSIRHLGELYHGGIVYFVDETGQHGLVMSKNDLNEGQGLSWRNGESGNRVTNARADGLGAGENNTQLIIAQQTIDHHAGQFAALLAANYRVLADGETPCITDVSTETVCYGNWYLPSAFELQLLHKNLNKTHLTNFAPDYYWSSTEINVANAWLLNFTTGELMASNKANTLGQVRAISRF